MAATGVSALAQKLGTKTPESQKPKPQPKLVPKKEANPATKKPASKKPAKKKSSGKRGTIMESLRPKILAMEKSGKSLTAIANELGLSDSYVWVIARNYKYDPAATQARRKKEAEAKRKADSGKSAKSKAKSAGA